MLSSRAPVVFRLAGLPGPEIPEELELLYHPLGALFGRLLVGLEGEVWGVGRLVGVGDAGELFDLARECLLVEALHVPLGADLQRGVDEDLDGPLPVSELALDDLGDGGLARPREASEPQGKSAFFVHARSFRRSDCLCNRSLQIPPDPAHTTIVGSAGESP